MSVVANGEMKTRGLMQSSSIVNGVVWASDARRTVVDRVMETCMAFISTASFHPDGTTPAHLKAYLWWAVFDFLREHGALLDAAGAGIPENIMPKFPSGYKLPRALVKMMEYYAPYLDKTGATAKWVWHLPGSGATALPQFAGSGGMLSNANLAGVDYLAVASLWHQYVEPSTSAVWETTFSATGGTTPTWAQVFAPPTAGAMSDWFASSGGIPYLELEKVKFAPDASAFAIPYDTGDNTVRGVFCCFKNFNAEIAFLLNGGANQTGYTDMPGAFFGEIPPVFASNTTITDANMGLHCLIMGFVMILSSCTKYKRGRAEWSFKYSRYKGVNTFVTGRCYLNLTRWHQLVASVIQHGIAREFNDSEDIITLIWGLQMLWEGMLIHRVNTYGGFQALFSDAAQNINIAQFVPPGSNYETIALPALLADALSAIGPVVVNSRKYKYIQLPVLGWGATANASYGAVLKNITIGTTGLNLGALLVTTGAAASRVVNPTNTFGRPYQFALINYAELAVRPWVSVVSNTGIKKSLTAAVLNVAGTNVLPVFFVDLAELIVDMLTTQGFALGGNGTSTTFVNRRRFDAPSFTLPRPIGGQAVMLMETYFDPNPGAVNWDATSIANMNANSTAVQIASYTTLDANAVFFNMLTALRVSTIISNGQWDQHQAGRAYCFGWRMVPTGFTARIENSPFVLEARGADMLNSIVANSMSPEFVDRYKAEKIQGQMDAYAVRGALAALYTSAVPKAKFQDMQPEAFLRAVVRNVNHFQTAPYYFNQGKPVAESGSWDWLEGVIQTVLPIADVIAAPFGLDGVVNTVGKGILGLLGTNKPASAQPAQAAPAIAAPRRPVKVKKSGAVQGKIKVGGHSIKGRIHPVNGMQVRVSKAKARRGGK
jgi:hypothetical protein